MKKTIINNKYLLFLLSFELLLNFIQNLNLKLKFGSKLGHHICFQLNNKIKNTGKYELH